MDEVSEDQLMHGRITVPDHVVFRGFEAETVLLNLQTGQYHGLNKSGGRMLELLKETGSVSETVAGVAAEYDQPVDDIRRDVLQLCGDLASRGLIEVTAPPAG